MAAEVLLLELPLPTMINIKHASSLQRELSGTQKALGPQEMANRPCKKTKTRTQTMASRHAQLRPHSVLADEV